MEKSVEIARFAIFLLPSPLFPSLRLPVYLYPPHHHHRGGGASEREELTTQATLRPPAGRVKADISSAHRKCGARDGDFYLNHPFYPPPQFLSLAVTLLFLTHTPASALVPAYAAPALLRLRIFPPWLFLSSPSSISSRPITRFFAPSSCALPLVYARTLIGSFSSSSSSLCSYERQKYGNERDHQHTCYTPREVDRESACARASEGLRALY